MFKTIIMAYDGSAASERVLLYAEHMARREDVETHLVVSRAGEKTLHHETGLLLRDVREKADHSYSILTV